MSFYLSHDNFSFRQSSFAIAVAHHSPTDPKFWCARSLSASVCLFLLQAPDQTMTQRKLLKIKGASKGKGRPCDTMAHSVVPCTQPFCHKAVKPVPISQSSLRRD